MVGDVESFVVILDIQSFSAGVGRPATLFILAISRFIAILMALVYSCCFWFSLRLGGILIGVFSLVQATITLVIICIGCRLPQNVKYEITTWMKDVNLFYLGDLLEKILTDPETYTPYFITFYCIYVFMCVLYIYGAYTCNNILMVAFILVELIRLITLSIIVTTLLLVLKQNTMDIGLVIGASVASGFVLLGMFYLWVCAANLPILINEMEREQHKATINTLQRLLETKNQRINHKQYVNFGNADKRNPFVIHVSKNKYIQ